jgi:hypothetical protein
MDRDEAIAVLQGTTRKGLLGVETAGSSMSKDEAISILQGSARQGMQPGLQRTNSAMDREEAIAVLQGTAKKGLLGAETTGSSMSKDEAIRFLQLSACSSLEGQDESDRIEAASAIQSLALDALCRDDEEGAASPKAVRWADEEAKDESF